MKPPYQITTEILQLVASISEKIGRINAGLLDKPSPQLRKSNRIKTIHSSLSIEGNTLTIEQITALVEEKRVIGPSKDIQEVQNAIEVYQHLKQWNAHSVRSFLAAHKKLMQGLLKDAGKYRIGGVGIVAGNELSHMAPPAKRVPDLMKDLFSYIRSSREIVLIKSCVFHYEMEFIHPFTDGNGRMGRLWQTLILMNEYPVFEFIPFENLIHQTQEKYYSSLSESDKTGSSTPFINYMLNIIDTSLNVLLDVKSNTLSARDRLNYFCDTSIRVFSRRDYMTVFKDISSATASRDLNLGVKLGLFEKEGDKNKSVYRLRGH